jgi:hypothetical protein
VEGDVPIDNKALLVTDFMNLKIKSAQSIKYAYRGRMCMRVFIEVSAHTCMSIYICTEFLKNIFINHLATKEKETKLTWYCTHAPSLLVP